MSVLTSNLHYSTHVQHPILHWALHEYSLQYSVEA